ncbi:hypothetical protein IGI04_040099, partial [Brassica rapa subsp. trilocularis]
SIAKITSALTRRLPGKSSTDRRIPGKSSTARRLPNSLAYIRLLQAHIITNESNPPRIVSFYDSMNHKNFRNKILGFFSSLWRESERYVVFSSQEWKKNKGKSILGALRASNWLFMVVVVLMTMAILAKPIFKKKGGGNRDCNVDLELQKCDCGVYQVEKIPCSHAIAAGTAAGVHISTLVWPVYSKDTLFAGYSENIYPCVGQLVEARTCFPPEVKRGPGRQKKSRWQSWLELSRMRGRKPRKQHRVYRCSVWKETGHKRPQFVQKTFKKLSKYIQRHLLPDGLPVFFVKRGGKFYPKSMTFDVLQSEGATITSSALRYSNGLSRICVWLQCVLNLLFVRERALNKQIRDHCDKRLHYLIEFFRANMRDNAVPDDDVPLRDRYPYSNPMLVLEVHRCIDIIHIHPPNLLRLAKRRYQACMIIPRPTRESSS